MRRSRYENIKNRCNEWGMWVIEDIEALCLPSSSAMASMMTNDKKGKDERRSNTKRHAKWSSTKQTRLIEPNTPSYNHNWYNSETHKAINSLGDPKWIQMIELRHAFEGSDKELIDYLKISQKTLSNDFTCIYAFLTGWLRENIRH